MGELRMEYQSLRQQLQRGRRVVFDPLEAPCDLPEDPDWPTPESYQEAASRLWHLPPRHQMRCMLIAVEMMLPRVWDSYNDQLQGAILRTMEYLDLWARGHESEMSSEERPWPYMVGRPHMGEGTHSPRAETAARVRLAIYDLLRAVHPREWDRRGWPATYEGAVDDIERTPVPVLITLLQTPEFGPPDILARRRFLRDWWCECRRRLAIRDPRETLGRTTGTREQYERIRTALEPREQRFDPVEVALLPEDPDWPTPTDYDSVRALMERLPHRAAVFCALTAAEMVLPIWVARYPDDTRPRDAIRTTRRWLAGGSLGGDAAYAVAYAAYEAADGAYDTDTDIADAAAAAYSAIYAAYANVLASAVDGVVLAAAVDAVASGATGRDVEAVRQRFYRRWWSVCRRRLAIRDVPSAEITWRGTTGTREQYEQIQQHLQQGITRWKPPEFRAPEIEEDPDWMTDWMTPTGWMITRSLLDRLPHNQQVICAITAVEMVLPTWDEWARDDGDTYVARQARQAIELTWASIRSNGSWDEVRDAANRVYNAASSAAAYAASRSSGYDPGSAIFAIPEINPDATSTVLAAAYTGERSGWWPSQRAFLQDWWSRCRARLAFRDVETAEVSGRTTGTREGYKRIRTALEPREQRFEPTEPPLLPEDPEWPTPTDVDSVVALLERLSPTQQVICALTAAEMVLFIWEERDPGPSDVSAMIKTTWEWVRGDASPEQVREAASAIYGSGPLIAPIPAADIPALNMARVAAADAGLAAANISLSVPIYGSDISTAEIVTEAVSGASYAALWTAWPTREAFFRDWWSRCRARLAFRDVETAEVSGHLRNGRMAFMGSIS